MVHDVHEYIGSHNTMARCLSVSNRSPLPCVLIVITQYIEC